MNLVQSIYPEKISSHYQKLVDLAGAPLARQCKADDQELTQYENIPDDGLAETQQMPVPHLIHRYPDRGLLLVTNQCAMHCRFCFRKRQWKNHQFYKISDIEEDEICDYLQKHPQIREVILSGGDPFTLPESHLIRILKKITAIPSIQLIRIGTRIPVVDPQRISSNLIQQLSLIPSLYILTHFNHPAEWSPESAQLCQHLIRYGIPIFNQTVLLKGINDQPETLIQLFTLLGHHHIKPHYLFHIDPVAGVAHFATGLHRAQQILQIIRNSLSSILLPTLAIDLPYGKGKILISPDQELPDPLIFTSPLTGEKIQYPFP